MCGRYMLDVDFQDIIERYLITDTGVVFRPSPEIFPSNQAPIVTGGTHRELQYRQWGFPNPYGRNLVFNARGETVADKPLFQGSFQHRRCLIPANGFFEWRKAGGKNIRHRIGYPDGRLFSLAGLYDSFPGADGTPVPAFTIITTAANPIVAAIHDRMPVILPPEAEAAWLSTQPANARQLQALLIPFSSAPLEVVTIG